jgi:hypothetical protein
MSGLTVLVLLAIAIWWYKPLREFLIQRTNRAVKVLLVVFPLLFLFRLGYGIYKGETDDWFVVSLTVTALVLLWAGLVWLGNWLERRRPTKVRPPDLAALSKLPGMPRLPSVPVTETDIQRAAQAAQMAAPHVQRAAQVLARAAADVDTRDLAGSIGRTSGRLVAHLRKSMRSAGTAPPGHTPAPRA